MDKLPSMKSPPHRRTLHRVEQPGHVRFLTFSCYRRLPLLRHDGIRHLFLERLQATCTHHRIRLLAWVLMPEHAHLLLFPEGEPNLMRFTHSLKRPVAQAVLRRWKQINAPILSRVIHGNGHRFWQTGGGYDRNLFEPEVIRRTIDYMHNNPVRRGLVDAPLDYPWSSARWYAGWPDTQLDCDALPW
jgi:putative transposase